MTHRAQAFCATSLTALTLLAACKDETGPTKLFEEEGYWSLIAYQLAGGPRRDVDDNARGDGFLLQFQAEPQVVQTALCGTSEAETPDNSQCLYDPARTWFCRCFAYAYEDDAMLWGEFAAGATPPVVSFADGGGDGGDGGDGTAGGSDDGSSSGDTTAITVSAVEGLASQYTFVPLPTGVFGSDGVSASYTVRQKTAAVWTEAGEVCQPCI